MTAWLLAAAVLASASVQSAPAAPAPAAAASAAPAPASPAPASPAPASTAPASTAPAVPAGARPAVVVVAAEADAALARLVAAELAALGFAASLRTGAGGVLASADVEPLVRLLPAVACVRVVPPEPALEVWVHDRALDLVTVREVVRPRPTDGRAEALAVRGAEAVRASLLEVDVVVPTFPAASPAGTEPGTSGTTPAPPAGAADASAGRAGGAGASGSATAPGPPATPGAVTARATPRRGPWGADLGVGVLYAPSGAAPRPVPAAVAQVGARLLLWRGVLGVSIAAIAPLYPSTLERAAGRVRLLRGFAGAGALLASRGSGASAEIGAGVFWLHARGTDPAPGLEAHAAAAGAGAVYARGGAHYDVHARLRLRLDVFAALSFPTIAVDLVDDRVAVFGPFHAGAWLAAELRP